VVGVARGRPRRGGEWADEDAIVVYVRERIDHEHLDPAQAIPEEIEGFRTDVIAVGAFRAQAATARAQVHARHSDESFTRPSTPSLVGVDRGYTCLLTSGHGTLPWRKVQGRWQIHRKYLEPRPLAAAVRQAGAWGHTRFGWLDGRVDYGWVLLEATPDLDHPAANPHHARPPYRWCDAARLPTGTAVQAWSTERGALMRGQLQNRPGPMKVQLPDRTWLTYRGLQVVSSTQAGVPFGVAGDSGMAVFDRAGRVVGQYVAGSVEGNLSAFLPLPRLRGVLGKDSWSVFFEEEQSW